MKYTLVFLLLSAVIMITFFPQTVFSLKCYICNSNEEKEGCGHGSDANSKFVRDCSEMTEAEGSVQGTNFTICRKIVTMIDFDVNNNTATERIVRKCGYISSKYNTECYYRGGFGGRQRVCSCLTDECNSGFTLKVDYAFVGFTAIIALVVSKF